jgi:starch synthase
MPARRLKVLFLASEVAPFAKTGGLADVTGSLPKALAALGHEVRVVMPAYAPVEAEVREGAGRVNPTGLTLRVVTGSGVTEAGVFESGLPGSDVKAWFVAERHLFDRPKIYGHADDPYRFAFFCRAALQLVVAEQGWRPDVVHAHDWHAAPALLWLATSGQIDERFRNIPTTFTIHNLMHQGLAPWDLLRYLGVYTHGLLEERYGEVNLMARAIFHATMITTVSPTYAREILTPEGGFGLDRLLGYRHYDLHGVVNGLDYDVWDPWTDRHLAARFTVASTDARLENKRALQARAGLPQRDDVPLVAMVTRLDAQKGLDITGHVVHLLMNNGAGEAQFVVLGTGAAEYEEMLRGLAAYHRDKMTAFLSYDATLAPLIYGGADVFLMPSRFEPCGLSQLIAMRYGCVPVVRATGGLADTVHDTATGFTFSGYSVEDFWDALRRALYIYREDQESWRVIQRRGMTRDSSWATSAQGYQQIYEWAIARTRNW